MGHRIKKKVVIHAIKKQSSFFPSLAPRWMNDESPQVVLTKFLRQPLLAVSPMAVMGYIRARRSTPLLRTPCSSPLRRVLRERMCSRGCGQCQAVQSTGVHLCESPNLPAERFDSSLEISTGDGRTGKSTMWCPTDKGNTTCRGLEATASGPRLNRSALCQAPGTADGLRQARSARLKRYICCSKQTRTTQVATFKVFGV